MYIKDHLFIMCDRCGDITYSTSVTNERPDGWKYIGEKDLCPECAKEYKAMIDNFFEGGLDDN